MMRKIFFLLYGCLSFVKINAQSSGVNCSPNLNFSYGNFTNWQCFSGKVSGLGGSNIITVNPTSPMLTRHTLIKKVTPSATDPYGLFPTTPVNASAYVLKLGNDSTKSQAERVKYKLNVPSNLQNFSITYQYAVILEDPNHSTYQQPRLNVKWIDSATGSILNCPSVEFVVSSILPGFSPSKKYFIKTDTVWYKPWSKVYVNLTPYMGKTIYLEVTTADCTLGAHFGYAYFDVLSCGENIVTPIYYCTNPPSIKVDAPPGFQTYKWWDSTYTNILATGVQANISPSPPLNSSFNLEIIPYNGFGCRDTIKTRPIIAGNVKANAGSDKTICKGINIIIGDVANDHYSYSWLPNSFISNPLSSSPIVSPLSQQDYYLTVYDSTTLCTNYDTIKISLFPKQIYNFSVIDSVKCINTDFSFTSIINSPSTSFQWNFNDGTTSTLSNPKHSYTTFGNHLVTFLVTDTNTCNDSLIKAVIVSNNPVINFGINAKNQCYRGNSFIFSNTYFSNNGGTKYNWNFGDNTSFSTLPNPQHSYSQVGNYTIKLYVTDTLNCIDSIITPIEIYQHPKASFSVNDSLQCLNTNNYSFTNTSINASGSLLYNWNLGDGIGISTATNLVYQYSDYGNKNVTLIAINSNNCYDTTKQPVVIYPTPVVLFNIDSNKLCFTNNKFKFNNKSSVPLDTLVTYIWSFGDGQFSGLISPSHSYTQSGFFNAKLLTITNNGCKDSTQKPITVFAIPQINITSQGIKNICIGDSTLITATALAGSGSINKYEWLNNGLLIPSLKDSFAYIFIAII